MAPKVTSSASRSKSKTKKPITTTKGRANRQSVSTAKVSDSSQRTNTGSAKVTGSKPPQTGPVRPSIGNVSGPASNPKPQRPAPTGPVRASIGRVSGPASNPKPPASKPSGNFKAPSIPKPAAPKPSMPAAAASVARAGARGLAGSVGRAVNPVLAAAGVVDQARRVFNPNDNILTDLQKLGGVLGKNQNSGRTGAGRRENPASRRNGASNSSSNGSTARTAVGNIPAGEGTGRGSPNDPPRRASTSSGGSGGGGRTSGGGSSAPSRSGPMPSSVMKASPASAPKPAEKKPPSGGSYGSDGKQLYNADKKDNPLFKRTFGYKPGDAPDQKASQAKKAAELKPRDFNKDAETTIAPLKSDYKLPEKKAKGSLKEFDPKKRRSPYA